jgi:hypothetical protein
MPRGETEWRTRDVLPCGPGLRTALLFGCSELVGDLRPGNDGSRVRECSRRSSVFCAAPCPAATRAPTGAAASASNSVVRDGDVVDADHSATVRLATPG